MPILHAPRQPKHRKNRGPAKQTRELEICALYSGGETLEAIGRRYGVSRERIRQITGRNGLRHMGCGSADPLKVLGLIADCDRASQIARRLGCATSSVVAVLTALAPMALVEMDAYRQQRTRDRLIERVQALAHRLGRTPTVSDFNRHGPVGSQLRASFGSLTRMHQLTGLTLNRNGHPHLTATQRLEVFVRYQPPTNGRFGGNCTALAKEYGVTMNRVIQIVHEHRGRAARLAEGGP